MLTGSTSAFYRSRRTLIALAIVAPLALIGAAWLAVDRLVLTPPVPADASSAEDCVRFMAHEKGLPRLAEAERAKYLAWQASRLVKDGAFRESFISVLRRSPPDEKRAFQANVILAVKPTVMADIDRFDGLETNQRRDFLDERIVAYNRLGGLMGGTRVSKADLEGALPTSPPELMALLMSNTTEQERTRGQAYLAALFGRISEINGDGALRAEFEKRIEGVSP